METPKSATCPTCGQPLESFSFEAQIVLNGRISIRKKLRKKHNLNRGDKVLIRVTKLPKEADV